jgi:hypothetical protein
MTLRIPFRLLQRLRQILPNFQLRVGKWTMLSAALWVLCGCGNEPADRSELQSPRWSGNESPAYRRGHGDGSRDRRMGKSMPEPREQFRPETTRADYWEGYRDGYRHPHDNPWSRLRAGELGEHHGRADRAAGATADPARHAGIVPATVRGDFTAGYRRGWAAGP